MKDTLRICMVQADLFWENKTKNIIHFDTLLKDINEPIDLIILPEVFNTGFTMNSIEMSDSENSDTIEWMRAKALEKNAVITGSIIFTQDKKIYNRLVWMRPDGKYEYYDKRHLFRMGGERDHFSGGTNKLIIGLYGWRICPLICYDLRFPVWSRNNGDYDLLIYVANWPLPRRLVWDTLLRARAIENQSYVCGVNRIGTDGQGIEYNGGSVMIDPKGIDIARIPDETQKAVICEISLPLLNKFRADFPVLSDRDKFQLLG